MKVTIPCPRCKGCGTVDSPTLTETLNAMKPGVRYTAKELGAKLRREQPAMFARFETLWKRGVIQREYTNRRLRYYR